MTKRLYFGPHLCRAVECLKAGYPENAASWMSRDIGEAYGGPGDYPHPPSLAFSSEEMFRGLPAIEYVAVKDVPENCVGAGI